MLKLIDFIDYRNYDTGKLLWDLRHDSNKDSVDIYIDSVGGYCYSAKLIQSELKKYKSVNFYIGKEACSEAANLLTLGRIRQVGDDSKILYHTIRLSFSMEWEIITFEKYKLLRKGNVDPNVFTTYATQTEYLIAHRREFCREFRYAHNILKNAYKRGFINKKEFKEIIYEGKDIILTGKEFKRRIHL